MRTLRTIPASNYCEKARWALQAAGIPFKEEGHLPLFHYFFTLPHGGRSVPQLSGEPECLDSTSILQLCALQAPWLYPNEQTQPMELYLDQRYGPHVRRLAYHCVFQRADPTLATDLLLAPLGKVWEASIGSVALPLIRQALLYSMNVNAKGGMRSLEKVSKIFDEVEERLGSGPVGSSFLMGSTFSAADLTFAAHSSLLFLSETCPQLQVHDIEARMDPEVVSILQGLRRRKAGQFALYLYQHHRDTTSRSTL